MSVDSRKRSSFRTFRKNFKRYYQPLYDPLRNFLDTITLTQPDKQWARVIMNRETLELVAELNPSTLDVLEISGDDWDKKLSFKSYKSLHYPDLFKGIFVGLIALIIRGR